jgi:hypothetical protein
MSCLGHQQTFRDVRVTSASPPQTDIDPRLLSVGFGPCVDGSELERTFFTCAALVGAAMCSAFECGSHDRWP